MNSICRLIPVGAGFRSESGFTMLEVLVSIAILGIAVVPMLGLFSDAVIIHLQREQQMRAAFLAQLKIEELKNAAELDFSTDYDKSAGSSSDFPAPDSKFRYTLDDDGGSEIKEIIVVVWYDGDDDNTIDEGEQSAVINTKTAKRRPDESED